MQDILIFSSVAMNLLWPAVLLVIYLRSRWALQRAAPPAPGRDLLVEFNRLRDDYQEVLDFALQNARAQGSRLYDAEKLASRAKWPAVPQLQEELASRLGEVMQANKKLRQELLVAHVKLSAQHVEIDRTRIESRIDYLTELPNRRAFDERACEFQALWERQGSKYGVAIFDLDHFKAFNDAHGHAIGDALLKTIGKVLAETRRSTDLLARIGGEEFALLIPGITLSQCQWVLERYRKAIETSRLRVADGALGVTASFGMAIIEANESLPGLLERADQALYAAKGAGRNRIGMHDGQRAEILATAPGEASAEAADETFAPEGEESALVRT